LREAEGTPQREGSTAARIAADRAEDCWWSEAEDNGKATNGDRSRYFDIARGSALACAEIQDVLPVCDAMSADDNRKQKALLDLIVAMLTKLGQRGYAVRAELGEYRVSQFDTDTDTD
jgi:hypothetical protein